MKTSTVPYLSLVLAACLFGGGCNAEPQIKVAFGAKGNLVSQTARGEAQLIVDGPMRGKGSIFVTGPRYVVVQLTPEMPEALVYSPTGRWVYDVPADSPAKTRSGGSCRRASLPATSMSSSPAPQRRPRSPPIAMSR